MASDCDPDCDPVHGTFDLAHMNSMVLDPNEYREPEVGRCNIPVINISAADGNDVIDGHYCGGKVNN